MKSQMLVELLKPTAFGAFSSVVEIQVAVTEA